MEKIKEILKTRGFIIDGFIIKNVAKLNLTINEFLLILYFININLSLDIDNIKQIISLSEEEILNAFNSLSQKHLIEIKVTKVKDKIDESICLDLFYDKLILDDFDEKDTTVKLPDIYTCFEREFGRTLSPMEYETINNWIENKLSEETIKKALKEAVLNGVTNLRYIDKILYEWSKKKPQNQKEEEYSELFDYNWLEDEK